MRRPLLAALVLTLAVAPVVALVILDSSRGKSAATPPAPPSGRYRGSEPPARIEMPDFELRDQWGRNLDSRDLAGRVVVLTFLDSHCTDACPIIAGQIAQTFELLTPAERREVEAVAVSTDPTTDTPDAVRSFLSKQHALHALRYLGAGQPIRRLRTVWRAFEILASAETGEHTLHSAPVRVYDRRRVWVSTLHTGADLSRANLAHDIRAALSTR